MFAILVLASACSKDSESTPSTPSTKSVESTEPAAARPTSAMKAPEAPPAFASEAGRYKQAVTFGTAVEKTVDDPNGGTWKTAKWNAPDALYMVQYADYADHATAKVETMVGFIPTRDKAAIQRDEPIKVGEREGRALAWKANATLTMYMRFIIDGKRVYKLGVGTKGSPDLATKFFDGFEITK